MPGARVDQERVGDFQSINAVQPLELEGPGFQVITVCRVDADHHDVAPSPGVLDAPEIGTDIKGSAAGDAVDRHGVEQPAAGKGARPVDIQVIGGQDDDVEIQVIQEDGGRRFRRAIKAELHEQENNCERDPADRNECADLLVEQIQ